MKLKDLYLPLGLIIAFLLGFVYPTWGHYLFKWNFHDIKLSQIIVFLIFGISGYLIKMEDFKFNKHLLYALLGGLTINLLIAPILALLVVFFFPLNEELKIGILIISCVPPTMATGIISTTIAKGNTTWAIIFTIAINLIGIIVVPFTFSHLVHVNGNNHIDSFEILKSLLLLVLLPAVIGYIIKRKVGSSTNFMLTYFQPTAIIFIAYCTVSSGQEKLSNLIYTTILLLLVALNALHLMLFGVCILFSKLKKLKNDEMKAFTFVSSQKTLPLALTILAMLPIEIASLATISCLLYHLSQVFVDSFIAYFWQKSVNENDNKK